MKRFKKYVQALPAAFALSIWTVLAYAQQQQTPGEVTTRTTTTTTWYGQWWVWAVGVAVFLIIVIALTNRGGRSNA